MSFTAQDRTDIIALAVAVWGAAPGASNLSDLAEHFKAGGTLEELIAELSQSPVFKTEYPTFLTNEEFVTKFVDNVVGGLVSADDRQWAIDTLTAEMNAGATQAQVILAAINALRDVPAGDENWGDAAQAFANRIEVAEYFSVTLQKDGSSMDDLKAVIADVDQTAASVTAGKAKADGTTSVPGQTFRLTTGPDEFVGGDGNDVFDALSINSAGAAATTLSAFDELDGGAGTDTLNIYSETVGGVDYNATLPNSATIKNIEIINIRNLDGTTPFTTDGASVVASRFEGAEQVWQFGWASNVTGLGAGVTAGFNGVNAFTTTVTGTGAAVNVALQGVTGANTLTATGVAATNTMNISGSLGTGGTLAANLTAGAAQTTANVNTAVATNLTLTGAGLHTLSAGDSAGAITFAGQTTGGANLRSITTGSGNDTVTLSAATTGTVAGNLNAGSGNNTITVNTSGAGATNVTSGAGNDTVTINGTSTGVTTVSTGGGNDTVNLVGRGATGTLNVDLGAGNDTFAFGGGVVRAGDSISGGSGTNTLHLSGVGASNAAVFTNFQKFDVVNMNGILDMDILAQNNTVLDLIGSGALGGASTLQNVGAGIGFTVTGNMGGTTLSLTQKTAGAITITMDADSAAAGANSNTATLNATNATSVNLVFDTDSAHTTAANNVQTIDLTAANTANTYTIVSGGTNASNVADITTGGTGAKVVTVTGSQALNLISSGNAFASVDASAMTGALTIELDDIAATGTVKLGSGADKIVAQTPAGGGAGGAIAAHRVLEGLGLADSDGKAAQVGFDVIEATGVAVRADGTDNTTWKVEDGLLTFLGAGPTTLEAAVGIAAGITGGNQAVVFEYVGNSYIYGEDGANDAVLIKLSGVTDVGGLDTIGANTDLYVFA